jgi:hypothetical protein
MNHKPTLVLDFDGVIHAYGKGWQDGVIYDDVVPGFFEWALEAKGYFKLVIFSSRSDSHKNIKPMYDWLTVQLQAWLWDREDKGQAVPNLTVKDFEFTTRKPAAFVMIDDRGVTFKGDWKAEELKPENLRAFKAWGER